MCHVALCCAERPGEKVRPRRPGTAGPQTTHVEGTNEENLSGAPIVRPLANLLRVFQPCQN